MIDLLECTMLVAIILLIIVFGYVARIKSEITEMFNLQIKTTEYIRSSHKVLDSEESINREYLRYTLIVLRPYMVAMQKNFEIAENFEEAAKCKNIVAEIDKLITWEPKKRE